MGIKYKRCPKCNSLNTLKILYGEPAESKEFKLGGCCIIIDAPEYYCKDCEYEWNREQAINSFYANIKGIKATVGGFFDGRYHVELDFITRKLLWSHDGSGEEKMVKKTIRRVTVNRVIDELKRMKLIDWKAKYIEPLVLDGTEWRIELIKDGRDIIKYGHNQYPKEWPEFCKIMQKVSGKHFS